MSGQVPDICQHRNGLVGTLLLEGARNPDVAAPINEPLGAMSRLAENFAGYQHAGQMVEGPPNSPSERFSPPTRHQASTARDWLPDARTVVQRFRRGRLTEPQTMA
jgi:hypothetical protein